MTLYLLAHLNRIVVLYWLHVAHHPIFTHIGR